MSQKPTQSLDQRLNSSEIVLLKSIALGLEFNTIQELLDMTNDEFEHLNATVLSKLQVNNFYAAVRVAYQNNLLKEKEFCSEKVKALALEIASNKTEEFAPFFEDSKRMLWELYDFLIEFHTEVEATYKSNNVFSMK